MRARGPCVSRHTRREREHRIDAAFKIQLVNPLGSEPKYVGQLAIWSIPDQLRYEL